MTTAAPAQRTVLERFPPATPAAPGPSTNRPAQRGPGSDARVVMDLDSDQFLAITDTTTH
ncbi:hypothetical protein [Streptomyces sp. NPDC004296]|uniref:hypothetical protein n=1 Tax=Streptomyces sp. NPDC004296 TaxID=3364697 RepID=UPI0036858989